MQNIILYDISQLRNNPLLGEITISNCYYYYTLKWHGLATGSCREWVWKFYRESRTAPIPEPGYTQGHSLPYKELRHTVSGFFNFLYEETNRRQRSSSLIVCFCFIDIMYPINWERAGTYIFINKIAWGMRDCLQLSCKAPRVVLSTRWIGVSVRRYLFSPLLETLSLLTNGVNQINSGDITGFRDSPTIIDYDSR